MNDWQALVGAQQAPLLTRPISRPPFTIVNLSRPSCVQCTTVSLSRLYGLTSEKAPGHLGQVRVARDWDCFWGKVDASSVLSEVPSFQGLPGREEIRISMVKSHVSQAHGPHERLQRRSSSLWMSHYSYHVLLAYSTRASSGTIMTSDCRMDIDSFCPWSLEIFTCCT